MNKSNKMKLCKIVIATLGAVSLSSHVNEGGTVQATSGTVMRIEGENRFETASLISSQGFDSSEKVFIAAAREFADALAGVPLAYQNESPILLAQGKSLHNATLNEINRLEAEEAIILGGEAAISKDIETQLKEIGLSTRRLAGSDRFETAEKIAAEVITKVDSNSAIVVDGFEFADAMSIAPFAARNGMPIYLTRTNRLSSSEALKQYGQTYIIGGENAVSKQVESQLNKPIRIAGQNRYETNIKVLKEFHVNNSEIYLATGTEFADALTGSVLAAKNDSATALVRNGLNKDLERYMIDHHFTSFTLLGGESAVNKVINNQVIELKNKINSNTVYGTSGVPGDLLIDPVTGIRFEAQYDLAGGMGYSPSPNLFVKMWSPYARIIRYYEPTFTGRIMDEGLLYKYNSNPFINRVYSQNVGHPGKSTYVVQDSKGGIAEFTINVSQELYDFELAQWIKDQDDWSSSPIQDIIPVSFLTNDFKMEKDGSVNAEIFLRSSQQHKLDYVVGPNGKKFRGNDFKNHTEGIDYFTFNFKENGNYKFTAVDINGNRVTQTINMWYVGVDFSKEDYQMKQDFYDYVAWDIDFYNVD